MKHKDVDDSKRYRVLSKEFINKYAIDTSNYDVIKGWIPNKYLTKEFVCDNLDLDTLNKSLSSNILGIQYHLNSQKAFDSLIEKEVIPVEFKVFNQKYNARDLNIRRSINSNEYDYKNVFSRLLER